jgi:hypothetical protein
MAISPYEQGGVAGDSLKQKLLDALGGGTATAQVPGLQAPPQTPGTFESPAPTADVPVAGPPALGTNKLSGFDMGKFADPNRSEKYKIGDVFSRYDPRGGVTPELLKELNGLGIADFSGQGDQLTVNNTKNDPRFGKGGTSDVIKGLKGNNADTAWQPWFVDDNPQQAAPQGGMNSGMPAFGGSTINNMLQSDAQGNIQQALGSLQQPGLLQALIAQLRGGQ